eukprot:6919476-Prorocentrum_lima.AAC.1
MTSSLVGSEMCIRDSSSSRTPLRSLWTVLRMTLPLLWPSGYDRRWNLRLSFSPLPLGSLGSPP